MNVERFMAKGVCRCFLTVPVGILILGIHSILITKRIIIGMGCILAETAGTSHRNTEIYGWCRFGLEIKTPEDSSQKTGHKEG